MAKGTGACVTARPRTPVNRKSALTGVSGEPQPLLGIPLFAIHKVVGFNRTVQLSFNSTILVIILYFRPLPLK
jgi:hypothetical protein